MAPRPEHAPAPTADAAGPLASERLPSGMRIAMVTEFYYPHIGGVCEHVHFLAREARARGHTVDIITSDMPGAMPDPHVIRLGTSQPVAINGSSGRFTIGLGLRRRVRETLRRGRYDVVHVHSPLTPTLPILAVDEAECPVVGTFHACFDRSLWYAFGRRFFQRRLDSLSAPIAVSHAAAAAHARYFDADWIIVPNGVDTELFNPWVPRPAALAPETSGAPTILFLGRLDPRNGLDVLLEAFPRVARALPEARLIVVGDGALRPQYERLAEREPRIVFTGRVTSEERPRLYAHADVYACPTIGGASFGITLLEAMACETPIVCSDLPGFRSVVAHEREALLVPRRNPAALAAALVRALSDAPLRARLGAAGRAHAVASFAWSRVADAVLGVYAGILARARAA